MELLLDICCLWVWSTEQGGKGSDKLGHWSLSNIKSISPTTRSQHLYYCNDIFIQVHSWSSGWCWLSVP